MNTSIPTTGQCRHCGQPIRCDDGVWVHTHTATGAPHMACGDSGAAHTSAAPVQASTGNPVLDYTVEQLRAFSRDLTRERAARLLPMWHRYDQLTAREVDAILDCFPVPETESAAGNSVLARAIEALRFYGESIAYEPMTRERAQALLPYWAFYSELTPRERLAVLDHFGPEVTR